jgi:hypothetical protein
MTAMLVGIEYVCHVYYCTPTTIECQEFVGYNFSVMKSLLFAVLLAVMQTPAPVPRKSPDPNDRTPQNIKSNPDGEKTPSQQPPTIVKPISAEPDQRDSHTPTAENAQQPITVRKLPPVSVMKDGIDRLSIFFTGVLIIVGSFGVRAAFRTLRAIGRQADQMVIQNTRLEESIGVARESIQIIINKERARIRVEVSEPPKLYPHDAIGELNELSYKIFCEGPTPAFIVNACANLQVSDSKLPSETKPNIPGSLPAVLHPNTEGLTKSALLWQKFDEDLEHLLVDHRLFLHFHGIIEYVDVFDIPRYAKFRYIWDVKDDPFYGGPHGHWLKNGGDEDNKAT